MSEKRLVTMTREQRDAMHRENSDPCPPGCEHCANAYLVRKELAAAWDTAPANPVEATAAELARLANWPVEDSRVFMRLVLAKLGWEVQ